MFGSTENGLYFVFISRFLWAAPPKNLFGFVFCSQYLKCGYENKIWEQLFNIFGFRKMSSVAYFSKTQLKLAHQQIFFIFSRYKSRIYLSDSHPDFIFPLYPTLCCCIQPKPIKQTFNCLRFSVSFGWWSLSASCWFWIIARLLFLWMLAEELLVVVMGLRLGYYFMILVEYFSWLEQIR